MDIISINKPVTKDEAAKMLGIKIYDVALPQNWLDKFVEKTKMSYRKTVSSFVWSYDDETLIGLPRPLTDEAYICLRCYDKVVGTSFSMDESISVLSID